MEASARFALCVALTNITAEEDWEVCYRLARLLSAKWKPQKKRRLLNLIRAREQFNIPCTLKLISLDYYEWKHLMGCLSQNDVGGNHQGNANDVEVYETQENWHVGPMDSVGFKALCVRTNQENPVS